MSKSFCILFFMEINPCFSSIHLFAPSHGGIHHWMTENYIASTRHLRDAIFGLTAVRIRSIIASNEFRCAALLFSVILGMFSLTTRNGLNASIKVCNWTFESTNRILSNIRVTLSSRFSCRWICWEKRFETTLCRQQKVTFPNRLDTYVVYNYVDWIKLLFDKDLLCGTK